MKNFKLKWTSVLLFLIIIALSFSSNPPNGRTGAPGEGLCVDCHNPPSSSIDGLFDISGFPSTIDANTTYNLTVTTEITGGSPTRAGFQLVILDSNDDDIGVLSNEGASSAITPSGGRTYFEHNPAVNFSGGTTVSWDVDWTSPAGPDMEEITVYSKSILANGNGSTSGDRMVSSVISGTLSAPSDPLDIQAEVIDVSCFGFNNGMIGTIVIGGVPPYNYAWSNGETTPNIFDLAPGDYSVVITDSGTEEEELFFTIEEPDELVALIGDFIGPSCEGSTDGFILGGSTGGTPPFEYEWSTGDTGLELEFIGEGFYTLVVIDGNNCESSTSIQLDALGGVSILLDGVTDESCFGPGSIEISVEGNGNSFDYAWSNGETTEDIFNLSAGIYEVLVTDNFGCTSTQSFTVSGVPSDLDVVGFVEDVTCNGNSDGVISLVIDPPANLGAINWSNGETSETIEDLSPGTYSVDITDIGGCLQSYSFEVVEPSAINANLAPSNQLLCFGDEVDILDIQTTGGTPPYSYFVNGVAVSNPVSSLNAGNYEVLIEDSNGCNFVTSIDITEPPQLILSASSTAASGPSAGDGSIEITATGGVAPYSTNGTSFSPSITINGLDPGTYNFTVTDANGCQAMVSATVTDVPCNLTAEVDIVEPSCSNSADGMISVTSSNTGLTYMWNTGETTSSISGLAANTYTVMISETATGCGITETITLNAPPELVISAIEIDQPQCEGDVFESNVVVIGGTPPYTFNLPIEPAASGTYTLIVEDSNGCAATGTYTIAPEDTTTPEIVSPGVINLYLSEDGTVPVGEFLIPGSGDNCGGPVIYNFDISEIDCMAGDSIQTMTISATDESGNTDNLDTPTTLLDTFPPVIFCLDDTTVSSCTDYIFIDPLVMDNCGVASLQLLQGGDSDGNLFAGDNLIIYEARDYHDNVVTCAYNVFVDISIDYDIVIQEVACFGEDSGSYEVMPITPNTNVIYEGGQINDLGVGTYFFTLLDSMSLCTVEDSVVIGGPDPLALDNTIVFDAENSNSMDGAIDIEVSGGTIPYTYSWMDELGNVVSTEEDPSGLPGGTYIGTVVDANGCELLTDPIVIDIINSVEFEKEIYLLELFPNPVKETLFIEANFDWESLKLYSAQGKYQSTYPSQTNQIDLSEIQAGIYFLEFTSGEHKMYRKIVKH